MFESLSELAQVFGAIGTTIVLIFGALKTYESAKNLRKPPATAYSELEKRVIALEGSDSENTKEISKLRNQVYRLSGVLVREVSTVLTWYTTGKASPYPDREVKIINELILEIRDDMQSEKH